MNHTINTTPPERLQQHETTHIPVENVWHATSLTSSEGVNLCVCIAVGTESDSVMLHDKAVHQRCTVARVLTIFENRSGAGVHFLKEWPESVF